MGLTETKDDLVKNVNWYIEEVGLPPISFLHKLNMNELHVLASAFWRWREREG